MKQVQFSYNLLQFTSIAGNRQLIIWFKIDFN